MSRVIITVVRARRAFVLDGRRCSYPFLNAYLFFFLTPNARDCYAPYPGVGAANSILLTGFQGSSKQGASPRTCHSVGVRCPSGFESHLAVSLIYSTLRLEISFRSDRKPSPRYVEGQLFLYSPSTLYLWPPIGFLFCLGHVTSRLYGVGDIAHHDY